MPKHGGRRDLLAVAARLLARGLCLNLSQQHSVRDLVRRQCLPASGVGITSYHARTHAAHPRLLCCRPVLCCTCLLQQGCAPTWIGLVCAAPAAIKLRPRPTGAAACMHALAELQHAWLLSLLHALSRTAGVLSSCNACNRGCAKPEPSAAVTIWAPACGERARTCPRSLDARRKPSLPELCTQPALVESNAHRQLDNAGTR